MIGLAAPFLDLVLVVGDRVSRVVNPDDDYIPIRAPSEALELSRVRSGPTEPRRREIAD